MPVDQDKASEWACRTEENLSERMTGFILFLWYQKIPQLFGIELTLTKIIFGILYLLCIISIASSPFWIEYLSGREPNIDRILISTLVLLASMMYIWAWDAFSRRRRINRKHRESERMLALRQTQAIEQMANFIKPDDDLHDAQVGNIICTLLNCVDRHTQSLLKANNEQYFQATLMVFQKNGTEVFIGWRAHNTRAIGKTIPATETAAYYVALANHRPRAIHDLKTSAVFEYKGLSEGGEPPYRSVLLIPISSEKICKGVVSIDASEPYEFWGARAGDLTVQVMPYIRLINLFLDNDKYGMTVQ